MEGGGKLTGKCVYIRGVLLVRTLPYLFHAHSDHCLLTQTVYVGLSLKTNFLSLANSYAAMLLLLSVWALTVHHSFVLSSLPQALARHHCHRRTISVILGVENEDLTEVVAVLKWAESCTERPLFRVVLHEDL